ncbi:MAG: ABC-ATPase domain-containing protein [Syntrophomonadaceae bacterium]|nr:ABC-ATPase domain-containing protein [Syntrophomonadaceae bacterium]
MDREHLVRTLRRIDGAGYKAYQDIRGEYDMGTWTLIVDHVQGDPFAAPSRVRARVDMGVADFPPELWKSAERRVALGDLLARGLARALRRQAGGARGSGRSGLIQVDAGGQQVLDRTAVRVSERGVEARLSVGLPAAGRRVLGRQAEEMLTGDLEAAVKATLRARSWTKQVLTDHVLLFEDQNLVRAELERRGLVAFVGNGAVLPRRSGVSDLPLEEGRAVRLVSPPSLEVGIATRHHGEVRGMGIPAGVTLIVGGGFHGKSTLLRALERGVYNHLRGDGREWVVVVEQAMKIRAEDGRAVQGVDIRPFVDNLPLGQDTARFTTDNASGSTSQAASIMEALEAGARVLLLDEDTSATNFMIRDARMQRLVAKEREPITPFIDRVRQLYEEHGVSTVLVMGGAGDYFEVADTVIMMDAYQPREVTAAAREVARLLPSGRQREAAGGLRCGGRRVPLPASLNPLRGERLKVEARGTETIILGHASIDIGAVEQVVDPSQARAIACLLNHCGRYLDGRRALPEVLELAWADLEAGGLEAVALWRGHPGDLARPRLLDTAAALNRLRSLVLATG